jgi:CheY-like chemotaxis protein
MMNGHIHVSSVLREGTEFTFDIQFTSFNRNDDVDYILKTAFKHHRILLIDTSETMKVYMDNYIGRYGIEVLHATSGEAALVSLLENKSKVDLILVDYYLQDMNAEALFNTIRAIPSSSHIPMFLIGGNIKGDSKNDFEGYLDKPLNPHELYDKIRQSFLDMNFESLDEDPSQDKIEHEEEFKILIAEDNEVNRWFMEILFKKHGYKCDLVCDGLEAIEAYKKKDYDMIFMDCQMPIMDGYKATEEIRSMEDENEHILIVAMTAYAMEGDAEKCFASGMDMYVSKPVDQMRIKEIIETKMKETH